MTDKKHSGFEALAKESKLYPQEALLKAKTKNASLFIGIPKETSFQENRIALTPEGVSLLTSNGHEIWIESGAGVATKFTDKDFSDAGAKIIYSKGEVFHADIILKVEPPTVDEVSLIKTNRVLISALQLGNQNSEYLNALNKKKLTALAYELIEDKAGGMPAVRAMSEIAGSTVMLIAAEYLSNVNNGKGIILGGITGVPPTRVVILGAGTVAEYAARTAIGLGADIQIFDNHLYKLRRLKHALGQQVYTSTINNVLLSEALRQADVVIGALRAEKGKNRYVVTEEMVSTMKPGSVVIDVSIDQGGCIETSKITTHNKPIFTKYGVIHYCVPNIASRVARTATTALSNIFTPIFYQAGEEGGLEDMIFNNSWLMKGVYAYNGNLTNPYIARKFNMKHKELNLLLAARFRQ
ncbi:MAG TPA: alanine dehydrogenase [Cyclobacteriaceae bacterium]|nr:alanine dehydrogenase [Cyclobacteriaceae bacterium]